MHQCNRMLAAAGLIVGLGILTGCEDPKARIALLEEENQALGLDLERLRAELDNVKHERDVCKEGLLAAQQDNDDLRGRVGSATPAQAMPADWQAVPGGAMVAIEGSLLFNSGKAVHCTFSAEYFTAEFPIPRVPVPGGLPLVGRR